MPKGIKGFQKGHKRFAGILFGQGQVAHHKKGNKSPIWKGGNKKSKRRWLVNNRDKARLYTIRRRAKIKSVGGSFTLGEWNNLKAQYNWTCPCCLKQEPTIKLEADHIIPLAKMGSNNIENIQPLCRLCNAKKHTQIIEY